MARRGENIHKRKDGRWEGRYIKSRIEQRILWGYVYGHSYAETREILIKKKAESGFYQLSGTSMTFAELSEAWLCTIANGLKESTLAHYRYTLDKYLLPVLGALTANEMSEALLEPALLRIFEGGSAAHKPLGTSSARECLSIVRRICHYAAHLRLIRPLDICVRLPDRKRPGQPPLSMEKQQELQAFLLQTPTPRKIGVLLGMQMGLRIGEICGLKWGDFDLSEGVVTIQRTVTRISCGNGHTKVVIQSPKTKSSRREIPLPKSLLRTLKQLSKNLSSETWFLSGNEEKPVEPRCYRKSIHGYLKKASVHQAHPHALRHTFATTCLQAHCDIKTLSELLGHSDAAVTLKKYVHSDMTHKRKEINRVFENF